MFLLFALAQFLSAALLFSVQLLVGKMMLPYLGGAPAVWIACMLFFQGVLLLGYLYAHASSVYLRARVQSLVHAGLLLLGLCFLPLEAAYRSLTLLAPDAAPCWWLLSTLTLTAGVPLLVISATSPLLQRWFAETHHPQHDDPYVLYVSSNLGSLAGLIGYPLLVEPALTIETQNRFWAWGYAALTCLALACAGTTRFFKPRAEAGLEPASRPPGKTPEQKEHPTRPAPRRAVRWVALAFVPSSLMLSVTTYLTTEVASAPFLWMVPLALYLATFALTFARRKLLRHRWMVRLLPMAAIFLVLLIVWEAAQPLGVVMPVHLATFFLAAMVCHGELAADRPSPRYLTAFYLCVALGGAFGGLMNAVVAPLLFDGLAEYPLVLVVSCVFLPSPELRRSPRRPRVLDFGLPALLGAALAGMVLGVRALGSGDMTIWKLVFAVPAVACYTFVGRPQRFCLGLFAILVASALYPGQSGREVYAERSFFGLLSVTETIDGKYRRLVHGTTLHGQESLEPSRRGEPLIYYHRRGPIGQFFNSFNSRYPEGRVGVVGLGAGSLVSYAQPGQRWVFYEIDPAVAAIAESDDYFSFLGSCTASSLDLVIGDARLRLDDTTSPGPRAFDVLVLDAFSSHAVPVHLLTREAVAVYLSRLSDSGILAFHTSSRFLDFRPLLRGLANDANLVGRIGDDSNLVLNESDDGREPAQWILLSRSAGALERVTQGPIWRPLDEHPERVLWTDDFSNVLAILKW